MRSLLALLLLAVIPAEAQAISRYNSTSMSCDEVRATIRRDGAAIMRYTSRRTGMPLYGRYVRDSRYCEYEERAQITYIPAADTNSCRVFECVVVDFDEGGPFVILPRR